ncbi:MAG TPA: hypothetical protein VNI60_05000 [Pyrinomonadaceae bacterium]|nr:hypothetical protein [Pyrinomonadaceae bacterium]
MKLANKAFIIALTMLTLIVSMSAQTLRPVDDDRNTAPTVGTGGPPGGPTGLFTIYDGQTLRRGEFTFSAAYSNYDRDPGDVDISEIPISFQIGLSDRLELFFNTDAYRGIKVNSPGNLSSFAFPNSRLNINGRFVTPGAIVAGTGALAGRAVFRPPTGGFIQFPFVGGSAGTAGTIGTPTGGNSGFFGNTSASTFPGLGSPFGSILPGVVLQTANVVVSNPNNPVVVPTVFTIAPSYLPDAPFINRIYGTSSFNTFTVGGKFRFTGPENPYGIGIIPFYRFYGNKADQSGFNQLQRGASAGAGGFNPFSDNRGDIGLVLFGDARLRRYLNVSANIGYIYNSSIKGEFSGNEDAVLLDRGDEVIAGIGVDFPVNRFFQPILEFRSTQYVGGRTPNAFENSPLEGLAGARFYPARYISIGGAYRHHFNQQDRDSFGDDRFTTRTIVTGNPARNTSNTFSGVPPGFRTSSDPHGFIFQVTAGRRNARRPLQVPNQFANVTNLTLSQTEVIAPCPSGQVPREGVVCSDNMTTQVTTTAVDPENDVLTYNYTVSGGRIVGTGANVSWDLTGAAPGTYTITAGVDDGCGVCGQTQTRTITVRTCDCVEPPRCVCADVSITGPSGLIKAGETMTFTANVSGGNVATYNWSVDNGEIISGQGTNTITVQTTATTTGNVTATLNTTGDCPECARTVTGIGSISAPIIFVQVDEFGPLSNDDVRNRLDSFFVELQNNPNDQGVIINYGSARNVARRETLIRNHIRFRNFDASRIRFERGAEEPTIRTRLIRVPPGAEQPTP